MNGSLDGQIADTGQTWHETSYPGGATSGKYATSSSLLTKVSDGDDHASIESGHSDIAASFTYRGGGNHNADLVVRFLDSGNFIGGGYDPNGPNTWVIQKRVAGTVTTLASNPAPLPVAGDVIKLVCVGSTLELYSNDILQLTTSDSFQSTVTKAGFGVYYNGFTANNFVVRQN